MESKEAHKPITNATQTKFSLIKNLHWQFKKYKFVIIIMWCKCTSFFCIGWHWVLWICINVHSFRFHFCSPVNIYSEGIKVSCSTSAQNVRNEIKKKKTKKREATARRNSHKCLYKWNGDIYMHFVYRRLMKCFIYIFAVIEISLFAINLTKQHNPHKSNTFPNRISVSRWTNFWCI